MVIERQKDRQLYANITEREKKSSPKKSTGNWPPTARRPALGMASLSRRAGRERCSQAGQLPGAAEAAEGCSASPGTKLGSALCAACLAGTPPTGTGRGAAARAGFSSRSAAPPA